MSILTRTVVAILCMLPTAWAAFAAPQIQRSPTPPLVIKSTTGADLYQFYCSNCHGSTGRGVSDRTDTIPAPADLTVLAKSNGGVFPRDRVRSTITFGKGTAGIRAHGTADMPVWGTIFRGLDSSDSMTEIRIENLVRFVESLQVLSKAQE
jgi:mono/diheme cytochrome c family protein